MSYEKQTWVTGETITADKLNHMEDGIGSDGNFVPTFTVKNGGTTITCDKTYEEVLAAITANKCCMAKVIWDGMQGLEEHYYLSIRYSKPYSDENFTFEQFIAHTGGGKVNSIIRKQIIYYSDGTIVYEYASRNFEE